MRFALCCRLFAAAALAALVSVAPVLAADEHDKEKGGAKPAVYVKDGDKFRPATDAEVKAAAGGDTHGEKGGLEFTGIKRYDLGIYTLIVFGLLMFVLSKYAWPHIKEGLEKREASILGAREEAKQDRVEAEKQLAEARRKLDETAAQIKGMLDEARKDAEALKVAEREVGTKDAQAERERAKREAAALKDALSKEVYEQAVQLAALMAEKALRREVKIEDHRRLLDESLAELKGASKA
jgi:F-type H+-transporting ATPase subunit b